MYVKLIYECTKLFFNSQKKLKYENCVKIYEGKFDEKMVR